MQERTPLGGDETRGPRTCMNKRGIRDSREGDGTGRDETGIMYTSRWGAEDVRDIVLGIKTARREARSPRG